MLSLNPVNKSYCLQEVCESNFRRLLKLAPELLAIERDAIALVDGNPVLHLKILDRGPYTLTVELTHSFEHEQDGFSEPAVKLRVYIDAKSVEVLRDHYRPQASDIFRHTGNHRVVLDYKWSINYFLEKWLKHCLLKGYCFCTNPDVAYETV